MDWELAQTVFTVICVYVFLKMIDNMIVKRDNRADDMALRIELLEDRVAKAGLGSGEASMRELKARVIVKSGVSASESSGGLIDCCHLDSIFEFNSRNYLRQVIKPA